MHKLLCSAALLVLCVDHAQAQRRDTDLPKTVSSEIERLFNDPATIRRNGATDVPRDSVINGTLAVRSGPVTIAGRVRGALLAINADVIFLAGARVDSGVLVVGGRITGRDQATIGGDVQLYAETLRYRVSDDALVVEESRLAGLLARDDDEFWPRSRQSPRTNFDFFAVSGHTYNRVEGFPVLVGPRMRAQRDWGSVMVQGLGILRTAEPMAWNRGSVGYDARAEVRWGNGAGFGLGGTAFDRIDPIEPWQMGDKEAGLAAVAIHRDFRDYYSRHGGRGFIKGYFDEHSGLTLGYGEEIWESRESRHPWSLFRDDETWRANPGVDDGHAKLLTAALDIDERSGSYSPGAGWYVHADVERGRLEPTFAFDNTGAATSTRDYTRGFVDIRRYNRVAPRAQVNFRVVAGGWLNGDALPLERRLSVSGPATLPGYDFRTQPIGMQDRLQCSESGGPTVGTPALCDRIALFQIEYRGDLSWSTHDRGSRRWWSNELHAPTWSVFFDAGRGWRAKDDGITTYPIESFPNLNTFKNDVGIGLDLGGLSVSVAKSVADRKEPANLVVRLSRRF